MAIQDLISDLPEDSWSALTLVCEKFNEQLKSTSDAKGHFNINDHERFIDFLALANAIIMKHELSTSVTMPGIESRAVINMKNIANFFGELGEYANAHRSQIRFSIATESFMARLRSGFYYEFSEDDIGKIQGLINELRDLIADSELLEDDYKKRLLRRLEQLQSELHKRVSDLDRFWGFVGDAGVMLGKFGEDLRPIVDRIKELAEIVWKAQARSENLPPGSEFPLLTKDDGN